MAAVRSRGHVLPPRASAILLVLAAQLPGLRAQPGQAVPCVDDCLAEALAEDPTKGCPPGTYWLPYPPNLPVDSCQLCPPGSYCPGVPYGNFTDYPVNLNRRILCPAGRFKNITGAATLEDCDFCPPGFFNSEAGSTLCVGCPAGTYSITSGSSNTGDCSLCPAGHFCPAATGHPVPCAPGTFVSFAGMTSDTDCSNCTVGHYCQLGTVHPMECPPGSYGNTTGLAGNGSYPGTFLPADWVDITVSGVGDTDCAACPSAAFCVTGSTRPTQCPAGTFSTGLAKEEADCEVCPVGFKCGQTVVTDFMQSAVSREPDGSSTAGSDGPEACPEDNTTIHFSFPNYTGCVENCPYHFERQSYCHVAGDGRVPDRTATAARVEQLIDLRGPRGDAVRSQALADLGMILGNLTAEEAAGNLTMIDHNGRGPLHKAAMLDDVPLLDVLLQFGGADPATMDGARDADGFTALMQALLLNNTDASDWLVANGATVTQADLDLLAMRGVESSLPAAAASAAPAYLGRSSFPWTGPSAADFGGLPVSSPMPTTTLYVFSTTTTMTHSSTTTQTVTVTSTFTTT
ncbi:unnamed protein product [Symbiodinium natans]|uniref:Tyrosine-protein kinase ephrin type A/B receptor-like domain-containing protein n=1 Tax=Symbiodinium natans TaxID=878477 RepID=A0A812M5B5_9DINO|nr:unnamed protein product [Symbiodinium natans]